MSYIVPDTNILLTDINSVLELAGENEIVILSHVLRELEKHKRSSDSNLAYKARKITRTIHDNLEKFHIDAKNYCGSELGRDYSNEYEDDNILKACFDNKYSIATHDILLKFKAQGLGIPVVNIESDSIKTDEYTGYKEITVRNDKELQEIYNDLTNNKWDLLINQYLIILDTNGKDIDCLKWDGQCLQKSREKGFKTRDFNRFKPYDYYQKAAIDSIFNNDITMIKGVAGTGKSLIALNSAWHLIERGIYDRLIIFVNPVKTKDSTELGYYKGTRDDKLLDGQLGTMLTSKFGDQIAVESELATGRLQLIPFSDLRGFDTTSERKSIVWIVEAQNTNVSLMKLGLERIGDGTKVIIDGDPSAQVDSSVYSISNGMTRVSEVFRGSELYGEVQLKNIYRSKIAEIASLM